MTHRLRLESLPRAPCRDRSSHPRHFTERRTRTSTAWSRPWSRPWTGAERLRFALLQALLAQILECAARREADAGARRWLLAAAERAEAPILLLDASGAILYANAAAHALVGRQPEETLAVFCGEGRSTPLLSHL